jgi:putative Mg2+ transporter-C (MgtC) family protein
MKFLSECFEIISNLLNTEYGQFIIRVGMTVLLSYFIGFERELTGHKGGIKTNVLIALGSCIFTSYEGLLGGDTRMTANIITGVGFLCSGFIFKNGLTVSGLGTAATLWCSAGLGMLTSRGFFKEALGVSIILFVFNLLSAKNTFKIKPLKDFDDSRSGLIYSYNIVCFRDNSDKIKKCIIEKLQEKELELESISVRTITDDKIRILCDIEADKITLIQLNGILSEIDSFEGVLSTSFEKKDT